MHKGKLSVLAVLGLASIALAAAHFLSASATRQGDNLVVTFREAGLGNNQNIPVQTSASSTAVYYCFNNAGKNPAAANKRSIQSLVSDSGSFTSDKNGSLSGTLTLSPPEPGFSCPAGQSMVLQSVTYTSVIVKDMTNNVSTTIAGTF